MRSDVIRGLDKMQKRLKEQDFIAAPAGPFLRDWSEDFKREAISRAPRWKEEIVRSIQRSQDSRRFPLYARVFSEVPQARWAQFGTGILSEDPLSAKQRYFPSVEGVRPWAEDHDMEPYALAMFIYNQGGTPPTRFFSLAAEAANSSMNERLARFSGGIQRQAGMSV